MKKFNERIKRKHEEGWATRGGGGTERGEKANIKIICDLQRLSLGEAGTVGQEGGGLPE